MNRAKPAANYKQTDVGVIPEEWVVQNLSDIAHKITDGDHSTPNRTSNGYYLLSARNVLHGKIDTSDVDYVGQDEYQRMKQRCGPESGDILISCSGTIGRVAIVPPDFKCVLVRSAALVKLDNKLADNKFIQYWLQGSVAQRQIFNSVNQGAQPNLFLNSIEKLRCALPQLPEQRAIADALSDADALISELDQLIAKKRDLKQAAMHQLLTGQRRLPNFSRAWEVKRLGDLAMVNMGQSPSSRNYNKSGQGLPLIQGNADIERRKTTRRVWTTQITKLCEEGDLILTVRAPVGEVAVASERSCLGRGVCSLRPVGVNSRFLFHALVLAEKNWKILEQGSTFTSANSAQIASFSLPIAPSIEEQIAIANVLSEMDAELAALEARRNKVLALKQGMMHELLTGRRRLMAHEGDRDA